MRKAQTLEELIGKWRSYGHYAGAREDKLALQESCSFLSETTIVCIL